MCINDEVGNSAIKFLICVCAYAHIHILGGLVPKAIAGFSYKIWETCS